ncbi:MerR family transcriptional regulator, partial [Vibrio parahaemolyticus]|nr:MerR family transcriptional regulator [Vibrio parahaemolyticus]
LKMLNIIEETQAVLQPQLNDISVVMAELNAAKERCIQTLKSKQT